jgi:hypothetical protein
MKELPAGNPVPATWSLATFSGALFAVRNPVGGGVSGDGREPPTGKGTDPSV